MINVNDFIELCCNSSFNLGVWDNESEETLFDGWSDDLIDLDILYSSIDSWEEAKGKIILNITLEDE